MELSVSILMRHVRFIELITCKTVLSLPRSQELDGDSKSSLSPTTKLNIESSYKGIELVFPISRENYYELIEGFQNKKVRSPILLTVPRSL